MDYMTDSDDNMPPTLQRAPPATMRKTPRPSYIDQLAQASVKLPRAPYKSRLLVLDIDETLLAPLDHQGNVQARPFLKTFLEAVLHKRSPWKLAFWTFSGRAFGIAHLKAVGVGDLLFKDADPEAPLLHPDVLAFWGYQDCGLTGTEMSEMVRPSVKDLDVVSLVYSGCFAG